MTILEEYFTALLNNQYFMISFEEIIDGLINMGGKDG